MRIAVVGSGIAGLGAAYVLAREHDVDVFERNVTPGGHTNTVEVGREGGSLALDTGFIVYNEPSYPLLSRLFHELGIRTQASDMSFSVVCRRCGLELSSRRPLARPGALLDPAFLRLARDAVRFLGSGRRALSAQPPERTLARFVESRGYSREFRDHYLTPLTAAIWSAPPGEALGLPAAFALRFLDNHGMLGFRRLAWRSVVGGSREYVRAILARPRLRLHVAAPVAGLARLADGVELSTATGAVHRFDRVVVATHADEALRLLRDPSPEEQALLSAFRYAENDAVLHTDERLLPPTQAARAAWNFHLDDCRRPPEKPTITYNLNRLQRLSTPEVYCVTLNRGDEIAPARVLARVAYHHPLVTAASVAAQQELPRLNGQRNTAYCGAYHGFGFHEDGLASGVAAARALGVAW